ncbi:MAG: hypothetical protein JNM98_06010 [Rhodocyclaceae bacterium]|nr:hypothetical protein [Rhodocyclaceae bacterium]
MPALIISGYTVPARAALGIAQTYEQFGGISRQRMLDGSLIEQVSWRRWRTQLSGAGQVPPGLGGLHGQHTLACVAPHTAGAAINQITLPMDARSDAPLAGYATVMRGGAAVIEPSAVSIAGRVVTVAAVAGAVSYQCAYYPLIAGIVTEAQDHVAYAEGRWGWSVTLEEL